MVYSFLYDSAIKERNSAVAAVINLGSDEGGDFGILNVNVT